MRYNFIFLIPILCFCQQTKTKNPEIENKDRVTEDSVTFSEDYDSFSPDSVISYQVEKVSKLRVTRMYSYSPKELYADIYFKEGITWESLENIDYIDSIIYQDDQLTRYHFPVEEMHSYFNLDLLDSIFLYSGFHQFLGVSHFSHIEYYEDMIESRFVVVFNSEKPVSNNYFYGLSDKSHVQNGFSSHPVATTQFQNVILEHLGDTSKYLWSKDLNEIQPDNKHLGFISYLSIDGLDKSLLVETDKDFRSIKILMSPDEYIINDMLPIPIIRNEKPVLILGLSVPETDILWNTIAIFNGETYELNNDLIESN